MIMDKWSIRDFSKMENIMMDNVSFTRIVDFTVELIGILYHCNGNIEYKGSIKDGKYDGKGKFYLNSEKPNSKVNRYIISW